MKVLVIRFSSIGDIVLTTPVIRALSKQRGAEVHLLTKSAFSSVVSGNPYISKIWQIDDDLGKTIDELKTQQFDHVIDLHNNLRSLRVKRALDCPSSSFNKINLRKWLLVNFKINRMPKVSIVDRYMDAARELNVKNDGEGLDFFLGEQDIKAAGEFLRSFQDSPYITLVLGAAHRTKQIPTEKIRSFLSGVSLPVVLIGGPGESELGESLAGDKVINAAGKCSIGVSGALLSESFLVVTPDTGMMHIAAALKKPMISVWGNTVPEFGMYAYYGKEDVFDHRSEVFGLSCRPCSKIGYSKCPKGHFKCMIEQNEEDWLNIIRKRVEEGMN